MEIPIPHTRYGPARELNNPLPSICDDDGFRRFDDSHRSLGYHSNLSPSSSSRPMSIQNRHSHVEAPPPLPPPRIVPISGPVVPQSILKDQYRERNIDSPSGDSFGLSFGPRPFSFNRQDDEGYQSYDSTRSPLDYPSPVGAQTYQKYRPSNDGIDSSMINKLNGARKLNRSPPRRSGLSISLSEASTARAAHTQLAPISLPHRTKQSLLDSPSGFAKSPLPLSAVSPGGPFNYAAPDSAGYRSPAGTEASELERSPIPRTRRTNSGSVPDDATVSTQGSYEMVRDDEPDFPMDETSRLRSLNIEDQWREREREFYQSGQKRRASSPPCDDLPMASDPVRRRDGMGSRGSPTPRLSVVPNGSSISSLSSAGRSGSYATASSITSMNSFGRRSPTGLSQGAMSPADPSSPYATPISITTSPRSSIGGRSTVMPQPQPQPHQRTHSIEQAIAAAAYSSRTSQRKVELPRNSVAAKLKGPYMCDCCPKKPKKFETEEELNAHTAEKQYECSYCGNRFKNKNEMERHQNSLHVRRHSWSCSALTGYERAFHDSTTSPGEADTCGYCGKEFERTGPPGDQNGRLLTDRDWEERIVHLQDHHKFRECNSSKKFYRADHFRQHLKHSHAGTSGKWTNMLENACMMEEEPPQPMSK